MYFPHTSPSRDGNDLPHSLDLKVARLRILPSVLCTIRHVTIMPSTVLCVGSEGLLDTQSACYGDSGGKHKILSILQKYFWRSRKFLRHF